MRLLNGGIKVVAAAFAVVAGAAIVGTPAHALTPGWQRGISVQSRWNTDFASDSFKASIRNAKADGVTTVTLVIPVHQDNIYTSGVYAAGDTPTDDAIASGLGFIRSQGMNAGIAIHDNPYDGQWRAMINPGDTQSWFTSYGAVVTRYARIAQSAGANQVIIGTELSTMTQAQFTGNWNAIIRSVRAVFSGSLTYSAQHAGYKGEVNQIGFWGSLDYVGISAYYTLYGRTDQAGMESAWKDWDMSEVAPIAAKTGKRVIFTEVGYVSRDGTTDEPGSGYNLGTATNTALQATAYNALFDYWNTSATPLAGIYLWDWSSDPNAGGAGNRDFTPQNKPAEAVMKQWYAGGQVSSGTGGGTTAPSAPTAYSATLNGSGTAMTGSQVAATVGVGVNNPQSGMIVDIEIYDASGARVMQTVYDNQSLSRAVTSYGLNWTPGAAGTYTVKVGVFTGNWGSNPYWNNGLGTVTVSAPVLTTPPASGSGSTTPGSGSGSTAPTQPSVPTQPSQPVPPTQPTQPSQPTTPPAAQPTNITIWWPGDGVTVSGVQPFKAIVDGRDASTYDIFWQVDGGQLNKLGEASDPVAHKESNVDLTGWNWQPSHTYVINFVAKDKSGAVLGQKAATILIY